MACSPIAEREEDGETDASFCKKSWQIREGGAIGWRDCVCVASLEE
ncbi:MAG: hypothetical protein GXX96_19390 [Planctomycetaceae bacterium]|nr:hypothetical protein [Planctomycetaceae bacterium]